MIGHVVSPFDVSRTLPVSGGLLVWRSLPGPPVAKITHANGDCGTWPGWAASVSGLLLTVRECSSGSTAVGEKGRGWTEQRESRAVIQTPQRPQPTLWIVLKIR